MGSFVLGLAGLLLPETALAQQSYWQYYAQQPYLYDRDWRRPYSAYSYDWREARREQEWRAREERREREWRRHEWREHERWERNRWRERDYGRY